MSKREQKWSKKYNYVLVHRGRGVEHRIQIGRWGAGSEPFNTVGYELLYRNPAANWGIAAHWIKGARKHPDYFGYQEPADDPWAVGKYFKSKRCGTVHKIVKRDEKLGGTIYYEPKVEQSFDRASGGEKEWTDIYEPCDPPAEPAPFKPTLCEKLKGKPGWTDSFGCPIPEHDFGVATDGPDGDGVYYVHWFKDGKCTGERYCAPDALEAL